MLTSQRKRRGSECLQLLLWRRCAGARRGCKMSQWEETVEHRGAGGARAATNTPLTRCSAALDAATRRLHGAGCGEPPRGWPHTQPPPGATLGSFNFASNFSAFPLLAPGDSWSRPRGRPANRRVRPACSRLLPACCLRKDQVSRAVRLSSTRRTCAGNGC